MHRQQWTAMASKSSSSSSSFSSTRTCLCSPTTHPGSFRCSLHRGSRKLSAKSTVYNSQSKLDCKTHFIKAFLMQIIKPSSHDLRRRRTFQPRPTRFGLMINSNSHDGVAVSWSYNNFLPLSSLMRILEFVCIRWFFFFLDGAKLEMVPVWLLWEMWNAKFLDAFDQCGTVSLWMWF